MKSAEEIAHVEMYREEISEDSVSVYPRDEELFLALALLHPQPPHTHSMQSNLFHSVFMLFIVIYIYPS